MPSKWDHVRNQFIVRGNTGLKQTKAIAKSDDWKLMAQRFQKIHKFDGMGTLVPPIQAAEKELLEAALAIQEQIKDSVYSQGPIKSLGTSTVKVIKDYGGDYSDLKDAVRGTLVVPSTDLVPVAFQKIKEYFIPRRGLGVKSHKEKTKEKFDGYSDFTIFVILPPVSHIGELQINLPGIILAKQGDETFKKMFGQDILNETKMEMKNLETGLGHGFYEVLRVGAARGDDETKMKNLSFNYYKFFRESSFRNNNANKTALEKEIAWAKAKYPGQFNH